MPLRPLKGCSLAFPVRLLSKTAVAFATLCRSCDEARKLLEEQESPACQAALEDPPRGGDTLGPASPAKDQQAAAFLVTICMAVDEAAETALASLMPAAAAAAEAAEAQAAAAEAARGAPEEDDNCRRVQVEIDDSDSSDECSDTPLNSSNSKSGLHGSTSSKGAALAAAAPQSEEEEGEAAGGSPATKGIVAATEMFNANGSVAEVPQKECLEDLNGAACESISDVDEELL